MTDARQTVFSVLAERARATPVRHLVAHVVTTLAGLIAHVRFAPAWWPLGMLLGAQLAFALWGLLARWGDALGGAPRVPRGAIRALDGVKVLVASAGTLAGVLCPAGAMAMLYADLTQRGGGFLTGAPRAGCTIDGRWRWDSACPTATHPAPVEQQVQAAVIDSLYFGLARQQRGTQRERVLLEARAPQLDSLPGAPVLAAALARDLPERAAPLLAAFAAANAVPGTHHVLRTVAAKQDLLDGGAIARFLGDDYGTPRDTRYAAEYVSYAGALGVLTLSRAAIDSARGLALVFAGLRVPGAAAPGRWRAAAYVLLRREARGRWGIWREIPVE